ncbi:MAG: hypothetical protein O7E57_01375 [Gammaproteobacteria bacterium]|nr:hypothetical protein [Gammaproteobacteria bacterium]
MNTDLCEHLKVGAYPFRLQLSLDEHLGMTDALLTCRECDRPYLLEMLDWRGEERLFRVYLPNAVRVIQLIRDLSRGSCDISRAGAEVHHLRTTIPPCRHLLIVDQNFSTGGPAIVGITTKPDDRTLPSASWRELSCDGQWLDYARSNMEMLNG